MLPLSGAPSAPALGALVAEVPLRLGQSARARRAPRVVRFTLPGDDWPVRRRVLAPAVLADLAKAWMLGSADYRRNPSGDLVIPRDERTADVVTRETLAALIRDALAALPAEPSTPAHYAALREYVEHAPAAEVDAFVREIVAALHHRDLFEPWHATRDPRPPAKTQEEHAAAYTERRRAARAEALAEGLTVFDRWLAGIGPGRHRLGDVWAAWTAFREEHGADLNARAPAVFDVGRTAAYAHLGETREVVNGAARARYLVIPTPTPTEEEPPVQSVESIRAEAAAIRERTDATLAENYALEERLDVERRFLGLQREQHAAGDRAGAFQSQRERLAATGTDGAPVDLGAYRAARR